MSDRLLVDVDAGSGAGGVVLVSAWPDGELPSVVGKPVELGWPLSGDELEDLRWYLEDYPRAPFGVWEQRGPQIAQRLGEWGQRLFCAVFSTTPARDAYVALRSRTLAAGPGVGARPEIVVRSNLAGWLGLPWELLADPAQPVAAAAAVALGAVAVSRSLPSAQMGQTFAVRGARLRVLMVISRPAGTGDVGYRMVARPLLRRLEAVRGVVELVVLRPPTVQALVDILAAADAAGEPFQVVHLDGHGVLSGRRAGVGAPWGFEGTEAGMLMFEQPGVDPDPVPAERIARVLGAARVPVVVLNACQPGAIGKQLEAAVATRLLAGGASSVVAMAYSVYAVAAAEFMTAFYQSLFAGDRVSDAVTAGRARLARNPLRPSPKGKMALADWVVPVHYLRRDTHF
ncbi:MAG TPA: CHAT domain-containing protein, partial [Pseudonocardiaceae bacterium]|nr:CHAT domain-containing protein [Pseudonocardiaceae bacterium]